MRDLVVSLVIIGLLPSCYRRPFVGLAVFSWLAYMRVQDLAWGFARGMRWSYYVAILTFAGFVMSRERRRWFLPEPRCFIMLGLVALVGIGIALSENPDPQQLDRFIEYGKIVAIALLTTALVTNRERLRALIWLIALSLGFYGVKSGIWGILTLARTPILRGPGGMLADNNDLALALAMATPMLFMMGWTERRQILRRAFWFVLPLTVFTIMLTHSRGGFLSVCAGSAVLVWRSRNRLMGIGIGVLVLVAALALAPQSYKERLSTIREYETEGSAASRIRAWGIATRMAMANPVFGVGMYRFQAHYMRHCFDPTPKELSGDAVIVAHSSYFQIWAECGSIALAFYLGMIFSCFWTLWRVRAEARARYFSSWIIYYATMFEASLFTFVVGSTFLNRGHFDLLYHWVALIVSFAYLARREMRDTTVRPVRTGGRGEIRHVRKAGFGTRPPRSGYGEKLPAGGL